MGMIDIMFASFWRSGGVGGSMHEAGDAIEKNCLEDLYRGYGIEIENLHRNN